MAEDGTSREASLERRIEANERLWATIMVGVSIGMLVFVIGTTLAFATHPPSHIERIDPKLLAAEGEFTEDNIGTELTSDGRAIVRVVARQFNFAPSCIVVPVGAPVTFRMTSADAIHGMFVPTTNINTMLVPGYVAQLTTRFDVPGVYRFPCHEFCGLGHQGMWAEILAVTPSDWRSDIKRNRCDRG